MKIMENKRKNGEKNISFNFQFLVPKRAIQLAYVKGR